jgi:hypothetical protein
MERPPSSNGSSDRAQDKSDREHDSDARGEHRYPDAHQTPKEREARQDRDDLKRKLGRSGNR